MNTIGKTALATVLAGILMSGSAAYAKKNAYDAQSSASMSNANSTAKLSKHVMPPPVLVCHKNRGCRLEPAGNTQPACRGAHKGPNGVNIQCD